MKFLSEQEFLLQVKPKDKDTYGIIVQRSRNFDDKIILSKISDKIYQNIEKLEVMVNTVKSGNHEIYGHMIGRRIGGNTEFGKKFNSLLAAINHTSLAISYAHVNGFYYFATYIGYLFLKFEHLKNSLIRSLSVMDKMVNFTRIALKLPLLKEGGMTRNNIKDIESINKVVFDDLNGFAQRYKYEDFGDKKDKIYIEGKIFSEYANYIKHDDDVLIDKYDELLFEFDKNNEDISNQFYGILNVTTKFYEDIVGLLDRVTGECLKYRKSKE